jgi:hypothetical protein
MRHGLAGWVYEAVFGRVQQFLLHKCDNVMQEQLDLDGASLRIWLITTEALVRQEVAQQQHQKGSTM